MASDFVQRVKSEIGIDSYISRYVKLTRRGKRLIGLCPFHKEKTPSFTVSPELQLYHCFGCNASGDIFKFVMDFERVDFVRSMEIISDFTGIPITKKESFSNNEKEELFALNNKFLNFYRNFLKSADYTNAILYLKNRGLNEHILEQFKIGYAPPGFEIWKTFSLSEKEVQNALKLGLLKKSDSGRIYDFFRDRIMFPIFDIHHKVCGFGGRTISNSEEAKYINSPASILYDKGKIFFNLNLASEFIRKNRVSILVEGYLDVIGLFAKDIKNVVAPLGTALTENQVRYLKSFADKIVILFDGDQAGKKAALRSSEICVRENIDSEVVLLPNGIDPFDLSKEKTQFEIMELIQSSTPSSTFIINESIQSADPASRPEIKKAALERLFEFIKSLKSEAIKEAYLSEGAKKLGISLDSVLKDFQKGVVTYFNDLKSDNSTRNESKQISDGILKCERKIISLMILNPDLKPYLNEVFEIEFIDVPSASIKDWIYEKVILDENYTFKDLSEAGFDNEIFKSIAPFLLEDEDNMALPFEEKEKFLKNCLLQRKKFYLEDEKKKLEKNNLIESIQQVVQIRAELEKIEQEIIKLG